MFKIIFSFATETAMGEYFPRKWEYLCLIRLVIAVK